MEGIKQSEVLFVVNNYIGVDGGYLGDFSYRTFAEFFPEHCDLELDPSTFEGHTTRYRFISILKTSEARTAARVLRGILNKYPAGSSRLRTPESFAHVQAIVSRLEGMPTVESTSPDVTSAVVHLAIADADTLVQSGRSTSAVDRMHTAFHGYLRSLAATADIAVEPDASVTKLFKELRDSHPRLKAVGAHGEAVDRILRSFASAVDSLNTLRNQGSVAHPNVDLLAREEATLYINAVRTLMAYLNSKVGPRGDG